MSAGNNDYSLYLFEKECRSVREAIGSGSIGLYTKNYETWKRARNIIRIFQEEIRRRPGAVKVLDIGCANGLYIFLMNSLSGDKKGLCFYGLDYSHPEIILAGKLREALAMDNISFKTGMAQNVDSPDGCFDIVLCSEVIEHIAKPRDCLKQIKRLLKPQGLAILTTPNRTNAVLGLRRFSKLFFKKDKDGVYNYQAGHISVKGLADWVNLIKEQGFEIERIKRGGLFAGGSKYDRHPFLFSLSIVLDLLLDWLPFSGNITENITFKLRKP